MKIMIKPDKTLLHAEGAEDRRDTTRRTAGHSICLVLAAVFFAFGFCRSAFANLVVVDDDFNDYVSITNTGDSVLSVFSNTNGIGGGFNVGTWSSGAIIESNSLISLTGHINGADRNGISSVNGMTISSSGSVFEFTNVQFAMNPITGPNGIDRVYVGVAVTNNLNKSGGGWQTTPPAGFYVQFESDSISSGGNGNANFDGNSVFFYRTVSGTEINLASWTFDTLNFAYSADGGNTNLFNFTPALDVKITIDGSTWRIQIAGDTSGGSPIDFSGNYTGNFGGNVPNEMASGYAVGFDQSSVNMSIDRVIMSEVGAFLIGTPQITTPGYPYSTNYVYAGEPVVLSDTVSSGGAPVSYQWQMQDPANSGTYVDIPDATNLTYTLDTSALGNSDARNMQLVVGNGSFSTNSLPVLLTVAPATVPVLSQDTSISPTATNYVGGTAIISASFNGNHPILYSWEFSADDVNWTNIPGATNTPLTLQNLQLTNAGYYMLVASNSLGFGTPSTAAQLFVLASGEKYAWSGPTGFLGLTAAQILEGPPGELAGAAMFGNGPITVSFGSGQPNFVFLSDGSIATVNGAGNGFSGAFGTNTTGNAHLDSVLGGFNPDQSPKTITLNNLVVGQQYAVQLFALDDRTGISTPRRVYFVDPNNPSDASSTFDTTSANAYMIATFYASNTVETINEIQLDGGQNMNALVIRAIGWNPPPYCASVANQITYAGVSVSFAAAVGSYTSALNYQWMAGPSGGPYTNLANGAKYSGADTATLTINNVTTDDGLAQYEVAVSNPLATGTVTSTPATLTVNTLSVTPTLLGEWLNGEQSFADESGYTNVHNGYIVGTNYSWANDVPPGKSGSSLKFGANNVDTVLVITNTSSTLDGAYTTDFDTGVSQNLTVVCWAKGFPPNQWNPWVSKGGEGGIGYQLREDGSGPNSCWTVRGPTVPANGGDLQSSVGSDDGQWHFYVGTFDGSVQTLYLDGVQVATQSATGALSPDQPAPLVIGAKSQDGGGVTGGSITGGSYFTNAIYDVRVYNYALTASQVTQLYSAVATQPPTLTITNSASGITLNWSAGTLLQATNLSGPWTTNVNTSPYTFTPGGAQMFFRVRNP